MKEQNSKQIINFLTKAGLDEKEIKVYLYSLSNGPQHATSIGKYCNITRTNVYDIVKKLEKKGLCYNMGALYGRKIKANPPSHLKELMETKEKELKLLKDELDDVLPDFKQLENLKYNDKTNVSYFEGKESIKKIFIMALHSTKKNIIIAGSELDIIEALGEEFVINFHTKRTANKIKLYALRPGDKRRNHEIFIDDTKYLREVRLRPEGEVRLKSVLILWDSYIAFCSFKDEPFGTLIENEQMSIMQKSWFDYIWKNSRKI